jgi:hypothetical protein
MALLIKADGTEETIVPAGDNGRVTYDQVRELIGGGYVEHVDTDPARARGFSHIWLDEEGKMKRFPLNEEATRLSVYTMPGDMLVGDVLFCTDEENMGDE